MKTLVVFGGTFNPIHIGHEKMLEAVCKLDFVDKVLIIPSRIPPHKEVTRLASDTHRLNMCRIVSRRFLKSSVSDIEIKREGKSYSIDTINELLLKYPDYRIFLCIGGDMLTSFKSWYRYNEILNKAGLLVFSRKHDNDDAFNDEVDSLITHGANLFVLDTEIPSVSSTLVRENFDNHDILSKCLSDEIYEYITENNIYGD